MRVGCIDTRYLPVPRIDEIHIDWRVLLFDAVVSMLTAIVFGRIPIHEISRIGIRDAINRGGSRGSGGAGTSRIRSVLVVAQIALSLALAINAALLLRSFAALIDVSLGFRKDHRLAGDVGKPDV